MVEMIRDSLESVWYRHDRTAMALVLLPLSGLFQVFGIIRRAVYSLGLKTVYQAPVPVIVVGNISVGGTGKSPLVIWLAAWLKAMNFHPGIISRGYGGNARSWPQQVRPDSDPAVVGDEAIMMARRTGCPVAVAPRRAEAVQALLKYKQCNIILSDDGLQHFGLGRDIEIVVIDGSRRHGNGLCLPAGPLRESVQRLDSVDLIVSNGRPERGEFEMRFQPLSCLLLDGNGDAGVESDRSLESFAGQTVHAVAGIGNPARFFNMLKDRGIELICHAFPDHHPYQPDDLDFADSLPVLMTEKDAVKCKRYATGKNWYFVPIATQLPKAFEQRLLSLIQKARQ